VGGASEAAGVAVGLAWTPAGRRHLFIEANKMRARAGFTMTASIGDVMQEAIRPRLTWVRSESARLGLAEDFNKDLDLQFTSRPAPSPKTDPRQARNHGPPVLASLLTDTPVRPLTAHDRRDHAQRQCAARGRHQGKFLAGTRRAGVQTIILPAENRQNVEEDLDPGDDQGREVHYASGIGGRCWPCLGRCWRARPQTAAFRGRSSGGRSGVSC